jgi:hypothetical protein
VDREERIKLFAISTQLVENELDRVERDFTIDLGRSAAGLSETDDTYYPQFDADIRTEAARMSRHYEAFYCLERTIRSFVRGSLAASHGEGWWGEPRVPPRILEEVARRVKSDRDAGVTLRSDDPMDFTTFGELGEIIRANWDIFGGVFSSQPAVTKVMSALNVLRGPIAHCSPLAEDEVVRLRLSVRDWFRLME